MDSHSPDDLISRTMILDTLITYESPMEARSPQSQESTLIPYDESQMESRSPKHHESSSSNVNTPTTGHKKQKATRIRIVTECLIGSSSSGKILQKLLKALESKSLCDTEMRKRASRIVCALAGDIRLKQFTGGIGCISSLLDVSLHEAPEYKELMLQGLLIIEKLATDGDNCRVMSDTNGLVSMIMRPLTCNLLHRFNHREWSAIVDASLRVLCCLLTNIVEKNRNIPCQQIAGNMEAIEAMQSILTCIDCCQTRRILATKVLITQLHKGEESAVVQVPLLQIFILYRSEQDITILAGEELVTLSKQSKSNALLILGNNNISVEEMIRSLCTEGHNRFGLFAAGILEGLCSHYVASHGLRENEPCFEKLKRYIIFFMPKLLIQTLPPQLQRTSNVSRNIDIEKQNSPPVSSDNAQHGVQPEDKKLQAALLSLCFTVYDNMINNEDDLVLLLDALGSKDQQFNFPKVLSEIVERNSDSTVVDCLRIVKYAARMTTSMVRHKQIYSSEDLEGLMNSLDKACIEMSHVDAFVYLSGGYGGDTLASIVQEAHAVFRPTKQEQKPEVSIKGKESEITEQGLSSSGPSDGDCLGELFRSTEGQQPGVSNKAKESEIIEL